MPTAGTDVNSQTDTDTTTADLKGTSVRTRDPAPSGEARTVRSCWRKRKVLRVAVICLAAIAVLGVGARAVFPTLLVALGNDQFSRHLTAPAKLKAVDIGLLDYRVTAHGLTINQPDEFGDGLFLDLPEVTLKLTLPSLLASSLTVEEVIVTDLSVHLVRDRDGRLNVAHLLRPAAGRPEATGPQKPVHIKRITVTNLTVQYTDLALSEEPLNVLIEQFDAVVTDVYLDAARSGEHSLPGKAMATAHMIQPGCSAAPLGLVARFGYLDPGQPVPTANAAFRLAGLELQPLHAVVPRGVPQAIGGNIVDVNVDVAMAATALDCTVGIVTPAGDALSLKLRGTPRQPLVPSGSLHGLLGDRAGEAGLNALKNAANTGGELGGTAFASVAAAGRGTGKMLGGIATGLFRTATSVSKGDLSGAGMNLWNTTSGTVTNTVDMLGNTGTSLATGARKTGAAAGGGIHDQVWRADVQQRWLRSWEQACTSIEQQPFPPTEATGS